MTYMHTSQITSNGRNPSFQGLMVRNVSFFFVSLVFPPYRLPLRKTGVFLVVSTRGYWVTVNFLGAGVRGLLKLNCPTPKQSNTFYLTKKKGKIRTCMILSRTRLNWTEIELMMYVCCFVLLNRYWEIGTGLGFPGRRSNGHVPTIYDHRRKISPCLPLENLG